MRIQHQQTPSSPSLVTLGNPGSPSLVTPGNRKISYVNRVSILVFRRVSRPELPSGCRVSSQEGNPVSLVSEESESASQSYSSAHH